MQEMLPGRGKCKSEPITGKGNPEITKRMKSCADAWLFVLYDKSSGGCHAYMIRHLTGNGQRTALL